MQETFNGPVALEACLDRRTFEENSQSESGLYSEIPDTPPPPAPPSIANRIPLQHIRCIGQNPPQSVVSDVGNQLQHNNATSVRGWILRTNFRFDSLAIDNVKRDVNRLCVCMCMHVCAYSKLDIISGNAPRTESDQDESVVRLIATKPVLFVVNLGRLWCLDSYLKR